MHNENVCSTMDCIYKDQSEYHTNFVGFVEMAMWVQECSTIGAQTLRRTAVQFVGKLADLNSTWKL